MASTFSNTEDSARYSPYPIRTRSQTTNTREANTINSSSRSVKKKIYLSANDINLAKDRLLALLLQEESEEYTGSREIILKENVSLDNYLKYSERDSNLPFLINLHDGKIKAYELLTLPRATASATIKVIMGSWNCRDLTYGDRATLNLGVNNVREPDSWVRPKKRIKPQPGAPAANNLGAAYPTLIIEVGHAQSLPDLHRKVALYFSPRTTIQIVIFVKIFKPKTNNTIPLIAAKYLRTSQTPLIPDQVISFGTANPHGSVNYINNIMGVPQNHFIGVGRRNPANGNNYPDCNGIGTYIMNIPADELFDGDPTVRPFTAALNQGCNLDLYKIQKVIREEFGI